MQIGSGKQGVLIGEYGARELSLEPDTNPVIGWLEPACENPQWIIWFSANGDAVIYTDREASGAVVGEPLRIKARHRGDLVAEVASAGNLQPKAKS